MKSITLEMSLKPFKKTEDEYIRNICGNMFRQWQPLLKNVETVCVLLWTADGSELFDYNGKDDTEFEWAYFIGGANNHEFFDGKPHWDPNPDGLHRTCFKYMENPPKFTYGLLKNVVSIIRETAKQFFPDKTIKIGTTVDVGPEFAKSSFKYERHPELCTGSAMGAKCMLCAYEKMHADDFCYASYPNGVPENTPFGTFFGKQADVFMSDMGFDYIWLSNGLGFGRETWSAKGALFDGKEFDISKAGEIKKDVVDFWKLFRKECAYPKETRGTNMSLGIDMATDGVPLSEIYKSVDKILPPPNSPWAALDGNFGLELMGYMSRIAEVPNDEYLFRFYVHDPWWVNSPWYDRYGGQPHDIYMPLAITRIDEKGEIKNPTNMNFLTVDNSFGEMPDLCVTESLPHLLKALKDSPDEISPVVWVYPFNEYSSADDEKTLCGMYSEDWFICGAINNGFPLSSVTSTDSFIKHDKELYKSSVVVTPVPFAGSEFEKEIVAYAKNGGKVIFYGNPERSGILFTELIGVDFESCSDEQIELSVCGENVGKTKILPELCGGMVNTVPKKNNSFVTSGKYTLGIKESKFVWLRGIVSAYLKENSRLPVVYKEDEQFIFEKLMNKALSYLGIDISFEKPLNTENPKIMISKNNGAYIFSSYMPSNTVKTRMKFSFGAPVLIGYDTVMENGYSSYYLPKAEHKECRIFVEQNKGIVCAKEYHPVSAVYRRIILVEGLENATVRFLPESYCLENTDVFDDGYYHEKLDYEFVEIDGVKFLELKNVTGNLFFNMPHKTNKKIPV